MREVPIVLNEHVPPNTMYLLNERYLWPEFKAYGIKIAMAPSALKYLFPDPWDKADRNPMPELILCPRIERVRVWLRDRRQDLRVARQRLRDAWDVLLHGLPPDIEEW